MAEYNKVYASLKPELPKVIQQEQIYVYAPRSSRAGMKSISSFNITAPVAAVRYDTIDGITVTGNSSLVSEEVSGETSTQNFQSEFKIPIRPGKYISMDATSDNKKVEVKVDDTALALDYIKIDKTKDNRIPLYTNGNIKWTLATEAASGLSIAHRNGSGDCSFRIVNMTGFVTPGSNQIIGYWNIWRNIYDEALTITKTTTDTGTLTVSDIEQLQAPGYKEVKYDNQLYYRYDPRNAPGGTLNFIHLDSIEDGSGGYKATGKCFSITVSTRAWKVFDLEFGGSGSGSGIERIMTFDTGDSQNVTYDTNTGAAITSDAVINYVSSTDGKPASKSFLMSTRLPIKPGKYISMNTTSDNKKMEVKVDDTALALDYWKINKTIDSAVPLYQNGNTDVIRAVSGAQPNTLARRDSDGDIAFNRVGINSLCDINYSNQMSHVEIARTVIYPDNNIAETAGDIGVLNATDYAIAKDFQNTRILYKNQLYYCMDPRTAPNGTLNFIHIDYIDDGNGGYKATGKCFSINVSTREWKVFDLDFGGSTRTTHNLALTNSSTGMSIYFSLTNNRPETYEGAPAGLWSALETSPIACSVNNAGTYSAGMITVDGDNFKVFYGNGEEVLITQDQVSITDSLV